MIIAFLVDATPYLMALNPSGTFHVCMYAIEADLKYLIGGLFRPDMARLQTLLQTEYGA